MANILRINIDLTRKINETWIIPLHPNDDPEDVFQSIQADPNRIWYDYNSELADSEDIEETVDHVSNDYEVE